MTGLSLYIGKDRREGASARPRKLAKIVVIAGPSGAGKSTLIRAFREGRLPASLGEFLPAPALRWPLVSANELARRGLPSPSMNGSAAQHLESDGLVVHYDTMRVVTRGYDDHRDDPAIRTILATGAPLDIVTIAPAREALFAQFLARMRSDKYDEPWEGLNFTRRFKRRLRRLRAKLTGRRPIGVSETHLLLLAIYGSELRFAHWTACWERFVAALGLERQDVRSISVTPDLDEDGALSFRPCRLEVRETEWRATA